MFTILAATSLEQILSSRAVLALIFVPRTYYLINLKMIHNLKKSLDKYQNILIVLVLAFFVGRIFVTLSATNYLWVFYFFVLIFFLSLLSLVKDKKALILLFFFFTIPFNISNNLANEHGVVGHIPGITGRIVRIIVIKIIPCPNFVS